MKNIILISCLAVSTITIAQERTKDQINTSVVYDRDAGFTGGQEAMDLFISENLIYPKESIENEEQAIIAVMFTIEKDGTMTGAKAGQNLFPLLEKEALRLVKSMPQWEPAIMNGSPVKQELYMPIDFNLGN